MTVYINWYIIRGRRRCRKRANKKLSVFYKTFRFLCVLSENTVTPIDAMPIAAGLGGGQADKVLRSIFYTLYGVSVMRKKFSLQACVCGRAWADRYLN